MDSADRTADPVKADVFPQNTTSAFGQADRLPRRPDHKKVFKAHLSTLVCFIPYLDVKTQTMYYHPVAVTASKRNHFKDTEGYIVRNNVELTLEWDAVSQRNRLPVSDLKRNTDLRTSFKYSHHVFLTKCFFTFGQRTVRENTEHLYQVGAVGMLLYVLPRKARATRKEKMFLVDQQKKYRSRKLMPFARYLIPEGTTYVICTAARTFFSVHVLKKGTPLEFPTVNPLRSRRPSPDAYRTPVPTPMIESALAEDAVDSEDDLPAERDSRAPDDVLMPPPPPPRPMRSRCDGVLPVLDETVRLVPPDIVKWYQRKAITRYEEPSVFELDDSWEPDDDAVPLDLTVSDDAISPRRLPASVRRRPETSPEPRQPRPEPRPERQESDEPPPESGRPLREPNPSEPEPPPQQPEQDRPGTTAVEPVPARLQMPSPYPLSPLFTPGPATPRPEPPFLPRPEPPFLPRPEPPFLLRPPTPQFQPLFFLPRPTFERTPDFQPQLQIRPGPAQPEPSFSRQSPYYQAPSPFFQSTARDAEAAGVRPQPAGLFWPAVSHPSPTSQVLSVKEFSSVSPGDPIWSRILED